MNTLKDALISAGISPPVSSPPRNNGHKKSPRQFRRGKSETASALRWTHAEFGSVDLLVDTFKTGETQNPEDSPNSWARIYLQKEPTTIWLRIIADPKPGTYLFQAIGNSFQNYTKEDPPSFGVDIAWDEEGLAKTRKKDEDNFNLILLQEKTGIFAILQVSVTTRNELFFLNLQELYVGQICLLKKKTEELADRTFETPQGYGIVVPLYAENAHVHANPGTMFPECRQLVEFALKNGSAIPIEHYQAPRWTAEFPKLPQELPEILPSDTKNAEGSWRPAVVEWFNLVLGFGHVVCEDDVHCCVHFKAIRTQTGRPPTDYGELPVLHPLKPVLVKYRTTKKGRQATLVVPL